MTGFRGLCAVDKYRQKTRISDMTLTHRIFLLWLLYIVIVIFGWGTALYIGLPQIALHFDHSYLTYLLFGIYFAAEVLSGRQAWRVSKENKIADDVIRWFSRHKLTTTPLMHEDGTVALQSGDAPDMDIHLVPPSAIADHFSLLCIKANAGQRKIRQDTIIDVTADRLYERTMIADFLSTRIVWIGIFATILGVIMAFWPMIDGVSIDAMRANLGMFFGGIAVAFIPTAVSFVFKIVLDFNSKIVESGVRDLIDKIAVVSETDLLPLVDHEELDAPIS
jgi:hypothetical protein